MKQFTFGWSKSDAPDPEARASAVEEAYLTFRQIRRPHERQWYFNAAFERGNHYVAWDTTDQRLVSLPTIEGRRRSSINRVQAKVRARAAKFLRNRTMPVVVPANTDIQSKLNARATTKVLEYQWRKQKLERKYREALNWSNKTGHGYWWFHWNPDVTGRMISKKAGVKHVIEGKIGDLAIEVVSPFEVLVEDPSISFIGDQPRIMRVRMVPLDLIAARWPDKVEEVEAESADQDALRMEQRIALMSSFGLGMGVSFDESFQTGRPGSAGRRAFLKELYEKPCPRYPKGRYSAVANGILLDDIEELPLGFYDLDNPYPCVDYVDMPNVGQYWGTTVLEQMIPIQKEYNLLRSKLQEHTCLNAHTKLLVARQHLLPDGAWNAKPGEIVTYVAIPNIPPPEPFQPPPISSDVWRTLQLLPHEMDDVSHIYPESEGRAGNSTSGFQTNLLQEATDQVHGPDIRGHEECQEEAAFKIRRIMRAGYAVTRLLTVTGAKLEPEVLEYSSTNIDDYADIVIQAGSALPTLKAARIQMINELWASGLLGSAQNPDDVRRVRAMLEFGNIDDQFDYDRADEEAARIENRQAGDGQPVHDAEFFENHQIHYRMHTDVLKSMMSKEWPDAWRLALVKHLLGHVRYINPQSALQIATEFNLVPYLQQLMNQAPQAPVAPGQPTPMGPGQPEPGGASPIPGPEGPAAGPMAPQAPPTPTPGSPAPQPPPRR